METPLLPLTDPRMKLKRSEKEQRAAVRASRREEVSSSIPRCPAALQRAEGDSSLATIMLCSVLPLSGECEPGRASREQHILFLLRSHVKTAASEQLISAGHGSSLNTKSQPKFIPLK